MNVRLYENGISGGYKLMNMRFPRECKFGIKRTVNHWYSCSNPDEGLARDSLLGIAPEIAWTQCNGCKHFERKGE